MSKRRTEPSVIDPNKIKFNTNEEFRHISGYKGLYLISSWGRVLSLNSQDGIPFFNSPHMDKYGYCRYILSKEGSTKGFTCHRLVANHFIPNPKLSETVNHIDGNKLNNSVNNLEWATHKENIAHARATGLIKITNPQAKLTDLEVIQIRQRVISGESRTSIAASLSVSINTISRVASGKFYKHVKDVHND